MSSKYFRCYYTKMKKKIFNKHNAYNRYFYFLFRILVSVAVVSLNKIKYIQFMCIEYSMFFVININIFNINIFKVLNKLHFFFQK